MALPENGPKKCPKVDPKLGPKIGPERRTQGRQGRPSPAGLAEGPANGIVIFTGSTVTTKISIENITAFGRDLVEHV